MIFPHKSKQLQIKKKKLEFQTFELVKMDVLDYYKQDTVQIIIPDPDLGSAALSKSPDYLGYLFSLVLAPELLEINTWI